MDKISAIKCPKCAAPLRFNGGGRVKSITCAYCKSILDIDNEFKVLGNFKNIQHDHEVPFKIGMQGVVEGIEYTIIGRVTYTQELHDFFWDDFLLFSALYGYAWLTYENGHTSYAKRERHLPLLAWEDMNRIDSIKLHDKSYKVQPPYQAKISYIEGELTWIAKKYDKVNIIDMYAPPFGISMEKSKHEIEFYASKYIDNHILYEAFNVPKDEQVKHNGVHELLGFGEDFFKPLFKISLVVMVLLMLILTTLHFINKGELINTVNASNTQALSQPFKISKADHLTTFSLSCSSKKALNNFNIALKQKSETLFSLNKTLSYINPKISTLSHLKLSSWEEGAKQVRVYLHLPKGDYNLTISSVDSTLSSSISVEIREDVLRLNYFVWMGVMIILIILFYWIKKSNYERKLEEEERSLFFSFFTYLFFYPFLAFFAFSSLAKIFNLIAGI